MTEQVELLNFTKSDSSAKGSTSDSVEKKEGLSLFDTLLMKSKSDIENTSSQKENKTALDTTTKTKTENKNVQQKNKAENLDDNSDKQVVEKSTIKDNKISNSNELKNESKIEEKTVKKDSARNSLLDRMILEANKKVSINSFDELKNSDKNSTQKIDEDLNSDESTIITESKQNTKNTKSLYEISEKTTNDKESKAKPETNQNIESEDNFLDFQNIEDKNIDKSLKNSKEHLETKSVKLETNEISLTKDGLDIEDNVLEEEKKLDLKENKNDIKDAEQKVDNGSLDELATENIETIDQNIDSPKSDNKNSKKENISIKPSLLTENLNSSLSLDTEKKSDSTNSDKIVEKQINSEVKPSGNISSLDKDAIVEDEQRVNIDKTLLDEDKSSLKINQEKKDTNLLDKIIENSKENIIVKNQLLNESTQSATSNQKSDDLVTNIFLSSQKNSLLSQMMMNKNEGVKTVKEGNSLKDIKEGAKILDLGLNELNVDIEESSVDETSLKGQTTRFDNNLSVLNKLNFNNSLVKDVVQDNTSIKEQSPVNVTSATTSTSTDSSSVDLNVNPNLALSIQNRIIAARQQMSSMMSDIARNMYENYRPPVTAFRINLIPAQLGHIAILMKNDKENSLSISMTMSQSTTHDAMVESQTSLRDALNRTFNANNNNQTSFNLDFNMDGGNSQGAFSQQENKEQKSINIQQHSSDEIVESIIQNRDVAEDLNYM